MAAARAGSHEAVEALVAAGADVAAVEALRGQNALMWSLSERHPDVARVLLDRGADPTIRDSKHGGDAIGWAQFFKRPEIVNILVDKRP